LKTIVGKVGNVSRVEAKGLTKQNGKLGFLAFTVVLYLG